MVLHETWQRCVGALHNALLILLKFGGGNSCLWKLILWIVELIFSHFSDTPSSENYFPSNGNIFLNESFNSYGGDAFSVLWKPFSIIWSFFIQVETVTKISGTTFFWGKTLFLPVERDVLSSKNCFILFRASFLQVQTVTATNWNKWSVLSIKWPFLISNVILVEF